MIEFSGVTVNVGQNPCTILKNISLRVKTGELLVLLGPSGCGKTTLLKSINRLIEISSGSIKLDGQNLNEINPIHLRRRIGYVSQHAGLFPHMTVAENLHIVLKLSALSKTQRKQRIIDLLDLINLPFDEFAERYPDELSGGQQQRISVARALANHCDYLLMDEPFSALDAMTRESLQDQILQLKEQLNPTIVFVTHDIREALKLADRIAVIRSGQIAQIGTAEDLTNTPATTYVRDLLCTSSPTSMNSADKYA